ncbi:MAG: c-type cytochrome [Proteobacteria bacterium]|nr:c-type cytochrome [Pseudomonadota bacterium]
MPNYKMRFNEIAFYVGVLAICFVVLGGVLVALGAINTAADIPHSELSYNFLHFIFQRNISARAHGIEIPSDLDSPGRVELGAQHYAMVCANCHGEPGAGQSTVALSIRPRPQYLPQVVGRFTPAELFTIVQRGVAFSAMPSWPTGVRDDDVWSMVAFLRKLPSMDGNGYAKLVIQHNTGASPKVAARDENATDVNLRPADTQRNSYPRQDYAYLTPADGFGDPRLKSEPVKVCSRCHGADGTGAATLGEAPNLTIQSARYLEASLNAFAKGRRKSGFMQQIAGQLTQSQMKDLAAYFAQLPAKAPPSPVKAESASREEGEKIALNGIEANGTPACAFCHQRRENTPLKAPSLAGQSATYIRRQLVVMQRSGRGDTGLWDPMPSVAHTLDFHQIDAVAAYFSSLPPDAKIEPQATKASASVPDAKKLFSVCVKCHTEGGLGDVAGNYPNLTIQAATYISGQLRAFRQGTRHNGKMLSVSEELSDADINSLAAYVNSLPPQKATAETNAAASESGRNIAEHGFPDRGVPACLDCHSEKATREIPLIARLQGQNVNYLRQRLERFADGDFRVDDSLNPMPKIAAKLNSKERADVAAYFALQQPLKK